MKDSPRTARNRSRSAFTVAEITLAVSLLAVVMTLVAQVGIQALQQRERVLARQTALGSAANVLEAARACPWEESGPRWAEGQRLPEAYAGRGWELKTVVEPEASRPGVKRVTVTVHWKSLEASPVPSVQM